MEYDNLIAQAVVTMDSAVNRLESRRRARARGLSQPRRQGMDEAYAGLDRPGKQSVTIDLPAVHTYTMTNDIAYIEPKARVY